MAFENLIVEQRGPVRWITLNRPDARNALSAPLLVELRAALADADRDSAARVVVITGAGEKAFSAGGDLAGGGEGFIAAHEQKREFAQVFLDAARLGKPLVAAVNGHCLAGAVGLLCACDLAVAADDAQFGLPEVNIGMWPYMVMALLFRTVGRRVGLELIYTGRRVDAAEAARIGLVNRAVPRAELQNAAQTLAEEIASKSPAVLRMGRRAFQVQDGLPLERALEYLSAQTFVNTLAEDAMEGVAAFFEKRKPDWKGR